MAILLTKIKNYFILYGSIFALVVFSFTFGRLSHASEVVIVSNPSGLIGHVGSSIYGQTFLTDYPFLKSIQMVSPDSFWGCGQNDMVSFHLCTVEAGGTEPTNANIATTWNCGGGNQLVASTTLKFSDTANIVLPQPINVSVGHTQYFTIKHPTGARCAWDSGTDIPDGYSFCDQSAEINCNPSFQHEAEMTITAYDQVDKYISIVSPEPNHAPYKDFPQFNFAINEDYYDATSSVWSIWAFYGASSTNPEYYDYDNSLPPNLHTTVWAMPKTKPLTNGTYYLEGWLLKNGSVVATSTQVKFYINEQTGDSNFLGGLTWVSTSSISNIITAQICAGIDTATISGMIECSFKKVIAWVFVPSGEAREDLENSANLLKTKFPFNTFFDLTTIVNNSISTTSTTTKESLGIPFIRKTATSTEYYIMPVITSSTMTMAIGSTNATLWRTGFEYIIWTSFGAIILFMLL